MTLSNREEAILAELKEWENKLNSYEPNDFELTYDKYLDRAFSLLPEDIQIQFFSTLDNWLFHLHAFIQGSQLQMDARERILSAGRVFEQNIESTEDLRTLNINQLRYIAEQQIARHRFYSFTQGGLAGTGGSVLLGSDLPAMTVINLRVVQLIAMTYGCEVNKPFEMMTSLKVFHAATLPARMQAIAWNELMNDLNERTDHYFYEGSEELTNVTWFEQPLKQMLKAIAIFMFKKKTFQNIPLLSMAIGARTNYQLTRKVTELSHNYYQLRYLTEKGE